MQRFLIIISKIFAFYNYIFVITLLYFYMIHLFQEDLIKRLWKYSKKIILTAYYKTFNEFKNKVIDFFENEIKN